MDLRDRRDLYNGFGDGLSRAFELAVTPAIFGAIGYGVDRWLGVVPLFTIVLTLFALVGVSYMMWVRYDADMKRLEEEAVWSKARRAHG